MEFLKDYDFELLYHPGKANVVADSLSRKTYGTSHDKRGRIAGEVQEHEATGGVGVRVH